MAFNKMTTGDFVVDQRAEKAMDEQRAVPSQSPRPAFKIRSPAFSQAAIEKMYGDYEYQFNSPRDTADESDAEDENGSAPTTFETTCDTVFTGVSENEQTEAVTSVDGAAPGDFSFEFHNDAAKDINSRLSAQAGTSHSALTSPPTHTSTPVDAAYSLTGVGGQFPSIFDNGMLTSSFTTVDDAEDDNEVLKQRSVIGGKLLPTDPAHTPQRPVAIGKGLAVAPSHTVHRSVVGEKRPPSVIEGATARPNVGEKQLSSNIAGSNDKPRIVGYTHVSADSGFDSDADSEDVTEPVVKWNNAIRMRFQQRATATDSGICADWDKNIKSMQDNRGNHLQEHGLVLDELVKAKEYTWRKVCDLNSKIAWKWSHDVSSKHAVIRHSATLKCVELEEERDELLAKINEPLAYDLVLPGYVARKHQTSSNGRHVDTDTDSDSGDDTPYLPKPTAEEDDAYLKAKSKSAPSAANAFVSAPPPRRNYIEEFPQDWYQQEVDAVEAWICYRTHEIFGTDSSCRIQKGAVPQATLISALENWRKHATGLEYPLREPIKGEVKTCAEFIIRQIPQARAMLLYRDNDLGRPGFSDSDIRMIAEQPESIQWQILNAWRRGDSDKARALFDTPSQPEPAPVVVAPVEEQVVHVGHKPDVPVQEPSPAMDVCPTEEHIVEQDQNNILDQDLAPSYLVATPSAQVDDGIIRTDEDFFALMDEVEGSSDNALTRKSVDTSSNTVQVQQPVDASSNVAPAPQLDDSHIIADDDWDWDAYMNDAPPQQPIDASSKAAAQVQQPNDSQTMTDDGWDWDAYVNDSGDSSRNDQNPTAASTAAKSWEEIDGDVFANEDLNAQIGLYMENENLEAHSQRAQELEARRQQQDARDLEAEQQEARDIETLRQQARDREVQERQNGPLAASPVDPGQTLPQPASHLDCESNKRMIQGHEERLQTKVKACGGWLAGFKDLSPESMVGEMLFRWNDSAPSHNSAMVQPSPCFITPPQAQKYTGQEALAAQHGAQVGVQAAPCAPTVATPAAAPRAKKTAGRKKTDDGAKRGCGRPPLPDAQLKQPRRHQAMSLPEYDRRFTQGKSPAQRFGSKRSLEESENHSSPLSVSTISAVDNSSPAPGAGGEQQYQPNPDARLGLNTSAEQYLSGRTQKKQKTAHAKMANASDASVALQTVQARLAPAPIPAETVRIPYFAHNVNVPAVDGGGNTLAYMLGMEQGQTAQLLPQAVQQQVMQQPIQAAFCGTSLDTRGFMSQAQSQPRAVMRPAMPDWSVAASVQQEGLAHMGNGGLPMSNNSGPAEQQQRRMHRPAPIDTAAVIQPELMTSNAASIMQPLGMMGPIGPISDAQPRAPSPSPHQERAQAQVQSGMSSGNEGDVSEHINQLLQQVQEIQKEISHQYVEMARLRGRGMQATRVYKHLGDSVQLMQGEVQELYMAMAQL